MTEEEFAKSHHYLVGTTAHAKVGNEIYEYIVTAVSVRAIENKKRAVAILRKNGSLETLLVDLRGFLGAANQTGEGT